MYKRQGLRADEKIISLGLLGLSLFLGAFLGYLFVLWFLAVPLQALVAKQRRNFAQIRTPLPPQVVFDSLKVGPNRDSPLQSSGDLQSDGFFPVTMTFDLPDAENFQIHAETVEYKAKVLEEDGLSQVHMAVMDQDGRVSSSVCRMRVEPLRDGSELIWEEVHDHFTWLAVLGFWISDYQADYFQAHFEALEDKPRLANRWYGHDGLMISIARLLEGGGPKEGPEEHF